MPFAGGSGTVADPYIITDVHMLQAMNDDLAAHYALGDNIDASETQTWNGGEGFIPIGTIANPFSGSFDGRGYSITDLYIETFASYVSLFGVVSGATIRRVLIVDPKIWSDTASGGLVGATQGGTLIEDCGTVRITTGYASGMFGAGLVCLVKGPTEIKNCYAAIGVSGWDPDDAGGLVAIVENGPLTVTSSYWDVDVSGLTTSAGGEGKTTAEMMQQATYTGWDFINTWSIDDGNGYPRLRTEADPVPPDLDKPLTVMIADQEVLIEKNSFDASMAIEERSVCSFTVIDNTDELAFRKGQPVLVTDKGKDIFGGVIDSVRVDTIAPSGGVLHDISCVDWHYLADKRIIAASYQEEHAGDIVLDIVDRYLAAEGVTVDGSIPPVPSEWFPQGIAIDGSHVQKGPVVAEAVFNYVPASQALDKLAEMAGFWWGIDARKRLFFLPRAAKKATRTLHRHDAVRGSIRVTEGNPKYRNRQYVKGGMDITDPQTERFRGDGEAMSFTVGFPIAKVPTIRVNNAVQTVGIKGVDTEGYDWYWSKGDPVITQDRTQTPLTTSDILEVEYQGEYPIIFLSFLAEEVEQRKQIEGGGTGFVDDVADEPGVSSRESAGQVANKKLERYGVIGRRVTFETWIPGLEPGTLLPVHLPSHRIENAELLVDSVSIRYTDNMVTYRVEAVEGPVIGSWTKMFTELVAKTTPFVIRENIAEEQILVILETFSKTWQENEGPPNPFYVLRPGVGVKPGIGVKPMFKPGNEVRYLAWYDENGEVGRKQVTQRIDEPGEILTTTIVNPTEANVAIKHLGWIGGFRATPEPGTGIELDKQPYNHTKSELEQLQVEHTHIKGW